MEHIQQHCLGINMLSQYCIYFLVTILVSLFSSMIVYAVLRMLIISKLEKIYGEKLVNIFHGYGNPKDFNRIYGMTPKNFLKFERMLYQHHIKFKVINKIIIKSAQISGFIFYTLFIFVFLSLFICVWYKL